MSQSKEEILSKALADAGLNQVVKKDSELWNLIEDVMQTYRDEDARLIVSGHSPVPISIEMRAIDDPTAEIETRPKDCKHKYLYCGYGVSKCSYCPSWYSTYKNKDE